MNNISLNIVANAQFQQVYAEVAKLKEAMASLQKMSVGGPFTPQATASIKQAQSAFDNAVLSTRAFTIQHVAMTDSVTKFGNQLAKGQLSLNNYYKIWRDSAKGVSSELDALATSQARLNRSIAVADPLRPGYAKLVTDINGVVTAQEKAIFYQKALNTALNDGAMKLIDFGKNTQWMGRQLTVGLTMPLAMFGATASQTFLQVDKELTRLAKVYGTGLAQPTQQVLSQIRSDVTALGTELARTLGISVKETASMAADLAATGQTGTNLINATREALRLATLGELDHTKAMQATVSLQNVYKLSTQGLTEAVNFLNAVENQTSTSLQDLVDAIPRVGPIVAQLGGSFKDTAAMMVAMKEAGVPAAQAANAIKSAIASLINPTRSAQDAFKQYGISVKGIASTTGGNPIKMIEALQGAMQKLDPLVKAQLIEKLFGKFQQARIQALIDNLGKAGSQTQTVFQLMGASSQSLANLAANELKTQTESASGRFKRMTETIKADLLPLGQTFLNSFSALASVVDKIVKAFQSIGHVLGPIAGILGKLFGGGLVGLIVIGPILMLTGLLANLAGNLLKGANYFRMFKQGMDQSLPTQNKFMAGIQNMRNFYENLDAGVIAARNQMDLMPEAITSNAKAFDILSKSITELTTQFEALAVAQREAMGLGGGSGVQMRLPGFASGVVGLPGSGTKDTIPAMLAPGESVITASATKKYGSVLNAMNNGSLGGYAGGVVGVTEFSFRRSTEVSRLQQIFAEDTAMTDDIKSAVVSYLESFVREGKVLKTSLQAVRDQVASLGLSGFEQTQLYTVGLSSRGGGASSLGARVPFDRALGNRPYELEAMRREQNAIAEAARGAGITNPDFYNASRAHLINLPKVVRGPQGSFNPMLWAGMAQVPNQLANMMVGQTGVGNKDVYLKALETSKQKELTAVKGMADEEQQIARIQSEYTTLQQKVSKDLAATGNELITQNKVLAQISTWSKEDKDQLQGITKNFLQYAEYTQIGVKARQDYYAELKAQGVSEKEIAAIATRNVQEIALGIRQMYETAIAQGNNTPQLTAAIIQQSKLLGLNITNATLTGWEEGIASAAQMRSPSKRTFQQGEQLVEGAVLGISSMLPEAEIAGQALAAATVAGFQQMALPGMGGSNTFLGMPGFGAPGSQWSPDKGLGSVETSAGRLSGLMAKVKGFAGSPMGMMGAMMAGTMATQAIPNKVGGADLSGLKGIISAGASTAAMTAMFGPEVAVPATIAATALATFSAGMNNAAKATAEANSQIATSYANASNNINAYRMAADGVATHAITITQAKLTESLLNDKLAASQHKVIASTKALTDTYAGVISKAGNSLGGQINAGQVLGKSEGVKAGGSWGNVMKGILFGGEANVFGTNLNSNSGAGRFIRMLDPFLLGTAGLGKVFPGLAGKGQQSYQAQAQGQLLTQLTKAPTTYEELVNPKYITGFQTAYKALSDVQKATLSSNDAFKAWNDTVGKSDPVMQSLNNTLKAHKVAMQDIIAINQMASAGFFLSQNAVLGAGTAAGMKTATAGFAQYQNAIKSDTSSAQAAVDAAQAAADAAHQKAAAAAAGDTSTASDKEAIKINEAKIKTLENEKKVRDNLYNAQMRNIDAQQAQMNIEAEAVRARGSGDLIALAVQQQNQQIQKTKDAMAAAKAAADTSLQNKIDALQLQNDNLRAKQSGPGKTISTAKEDAALAAAQAALSAAQSGKGAGAQKVQSDINIQLEKEYNDWLEKHKSLWQKIAGYASDLWNWMQKIWDKLTKPIKEVFSGIWSGAVNAIKDIWNWMDKIWTKLTKPVGSWLSQMWKDIKTWASDAWGFVSNIFNAISKPISGWFTTIWDKLSQVIKDIANAITSVASVIAKLASGPLGILGSIFGNLITTITKKLGLASGGYVSGPGTSTSDSIPAQLSNGEYVVNAAAVSKYGSGFLDQVNTQKFASGGQVGSSKNKGTSIWNDLTAGIKWAWKEINKPNTYTMIDKNGKKQTIKLADDTIITPSSIAKAVPTLAEDAAKLYKAAFAARDAAEAEKAAKLAQLSKTPEFAPIENFINKPMTAYNSFAENFNKQATSFFEKNNLKIPTGHETYRGLSLTDISQLHNLKVGETWIPKVVKSTTTLDSEAASAASKNSVTGGGWTNSVAKIEVVNPNGISGIHSMEAIGRTTGIGGEGLMGPATRYKVAAIYPTGELLAPMSVIKDGIAKTIIPQAASYVLHAYANGGLVSGFGSSTSDSIPAMLSNGEYVISADAANKYGKAFLDAVNNKSFSVPQSEIVAGRSSMISDMVSSNSTIYGGNVINVYPPQGADANQVANLVITKINQSIQKQTTRRNV